MDKEKGKYNFNRLSFPLIMVLLIYCMPTYSNVTISDSIVNKKLLEMSINDLMDIKVVTASKHEQSIKEAPSSMTVISSDDIEKYGYESLAEVLSSVRGFYVTYDRNYEYAGVRGFGEPTNYNKRFLILIDGHTMNEDFYGQSWIGNDLGLDLDFVERIEVIRGPGSALYGTGAMLGVINIITKKAENIASTGTANYGFKISNEIGSYGKYVEKAYFGKEFKNGLKLSGSGLWGDIKGQNLYFKEFANIANNGVAENLDWEKYSGLFLKADYKNLFIYGFIDSRKKAVPTASYGTTFNDKNFNTLDERKYLETKYEVDFGADIKDLTIKQAVHKKLMLRAYLDNYNYSAQYPYQDNYQFESNSDYWTGAEAQFQIDFPKNNNLIVGAEYQNHFQPDYEQWDNYRVFYDKSFPFSVFSIYVQDEYKLLNNLSFTLGGRYVKYSTTGEAAMPRFAVIYSPFKNSIIKLLYGDAFRTPNIYERSYESLGDAAVANPDLRHENTRSIEVEYEQQIAKGIFGIISVYQTYLNNLIGSADVKLPKPFFDPVQGDSVYYVSQYQNLNKIIAKGIEMELQTRFKSGINGYASYIIQSSKDEIIHNNIANSPEQIFKAGISLPVLKSFNAAAEMYYESARITSDSNFSKTNPFVLVNLNLSSKVLFGHLKLAFKINNLFNTPYDYPAGIELNRHNNALYSLHQDGRNYLIKVSYLF